MSPVSLVFYTKVTWDWSQKCIRNRHSRSITLDILISFSQLTTGQSLMQTLDHLNPKFGTFPWHVLLFCTAISYSLYLFHEHITANCNLNNLKQMLQELFTLFLPHNIFSNICTKNHARNKITLGIWMLKMCGIQNIKTSQLAKGLLFQWHQNGRKCIKGCTIF